MVFAGGVADASTTTRWGWNIAWVGDSGAIYSSEQRAVDAAILRVLPPYSDHNRGYCEVATGSGNGDGSFNWSQTCAGVAYIGGPFLAPQTYTGTYWSIYHQEIEVFFFVKSNVLSDTDCHICLGDPINPATGAVFSGELDLIDAGSGVLGLNRHYNSNGSIATDLGTPWRHGFSRSIAVENLIAIARPYSLSPTTSSCYSDPASACTSGFAEIQSGVPNWAGASPTYVENLCKIIKSGVAIGILPVYTTDLYPLPLSVPTAYNVTRDDGQLIRFTILGGVITAPPGIALKLQETASGYALTDASDTTETYDSNGVLQIITTRTGVVQTMFYDTSGRLSTVTDSFGHQLTLGYDPQNRVISVTRQ